MNQEEMSQEETARLLAACEDQLEDIGNTLVDGLRFAIRDRFGDPKPVPATSTTAPLLVIEREMQHGWEPYICFSGAAFAFRSKSCAVKAMEDVIDSEGSGFRIARYRRIKPKLKRKTFPNPTMTAESGFEIGSIVVLRSGGPQMTVERIDGTTVSCLWFDDGKLGSGDFHTEVLKHV